MSRILEVDNIIGQRFGRLVIIGRGGYAVDALGNKRAKALCKCDCGSEKSIRRKDLLNGKTKSCGCITKDKGIARMLLAKNKVKKKRGRRTTHGMTNTPEFAAWRAMQNRCYNKNVVSFKHYGGRGITVCERWRNSFQDFFSDMGKRTSSKHSLDRIDNNGNYEPTNCRWATAKEQIANQRPGSLQRIFSHNGKTMCLSAWARESGIKVRTLLTRIERGKMKFEDAIRLDNFRGSRLYNDSRKSK